MSTLDNCWIAAAHEAAHAVAAVHGAGPETGWDCAGYGAAFRIWLK